jgi:hypothetical protein
MVSAMMERSSMAGMGMPTLTPQGVPMGMPSGMSLMMVPRCKLKIEKCQGGLKITCSCDDKMAASMVQNLCSMLAGGMCSCCLMMNGLVVCSCNLTMGMCKVEMTDKGCCVTCTSGDQKCAEIISACCDCMSVMLKDGCTCCLMLNNTPVACGCA